MPGRVVHVLGGLISNRDRSKSTVSLKQDTPQLSLRILTTEGDTLFEAFEALNLKRSQMYIFSCGELLCVATSRQCTHTNLPLKQLSVLH